MIAMPIEYTDYFGNVRKETFYFGFNESEVTEMEMSKGGGLSTYLENIVKSNEREKIVPIFKDLILKAYGEKSEDGRRFIKEGGKRAEAFSETPAYNELFLKLATDSKAAADFVKGIMPSSKRLEELTRNANASNITPVQ